MAEPPGSYEFEPLSQRIIGAALEVHTRLGPGFRESVYEEALRLELDKRGIDWERGKVIAVQYDGVLVGTHRLDLVVSGSVVVELKAVSAFLEVRTAQLRAYLRAADLRVGLLLNFGAMPLGIKRLVNKY